MMMMLLKRLRNSINGVQHGGGERVAVALELNKSPRLSTTAERNSMSGDGRINLGEKFRKLLKNDSF
ncbi:hypothetical protein HFN59_19890 [Rhizobium leguminosarum]|uniref:hypothetical protein n=1 Tax=Rhizobium leguminosarum TaxID=384 RepID=UPI001C94E212|nr:hypothetical protein [Rhizobium leguminosarum]MBY5779346.1 hypothetical protein [Rhizobium leguminosarum]